MVRTGDIAPSIIIEPIDEKPVIDSVALLIEDKTTAKLGIAIIEGGEWKVKILGAGKSSGNGGDDFSWIDGWSIRHSGKVDKLCVGRSEAASAVIFWDGSKYKWQQEGD